MTNPGIKTSVRMLTLAAYQTWFSGRYTVPNETNRTRIFDGLDTQSSSPLRTD
jgi:hypothetical protein